MKLELIVIFYLFLTLGCESDDEGSAAQQPCYFALSNTCVTIEGVSSDSPPQKGKATASFASAHTGQSEQGSCPVPPLDSLPSDEVQAFVCGSVRIGRSGKVDTSTGEGECTYGDVKFILKKENLVIKGFVGTSEIPITCSEMSATKVPAP